MSSISEILDLFARIDDGACKEIVNDAEILTAGMLWIPSPGPQTDGYLCDADELFFGGQAGGGKSDVLLGLSVTAHQRSLIIRRTHRESLGLVERLAEIVGNRDGWSGQKSMWRLGSRTIEIGGCQQEEDKQKYKGQPHDLTCFDEVSDFSETQYTFISGWNRSTTPGQRCRIVCAGNPPTRKDGLWVIRRWAAWLDPEHSNPAMPGELRWYTTGDEGKEIEVDGRGPHIINGEEVFARSRTFIPSKLSDNPYLSVTNYGANLAALPEPFRSAYRDGIFNKMLSDESNQVIPTAWIRAAQARWSPRPPSGIPMCAIGVDVAQGGTDRTVLAIRHDGWYAPLVDFPGTDTPDGPAIAGKVFSKWRDNATVIIDCGGGYGGGALTHLKGNGVTCFGYVGSKAAVGRTGDKQLSFTNTRAEAYWRFREALDPEQPGGSPIFLPEDTELVAELIQPNYFMMANGKIAITPKDDVTKELGRSPDKADAVIMAWWKGDKNANFIGGFQANNSLPKYNTRNSR